MPLTTSGLARCRPVRNLSLYPSIQTALIEGCLARLHCSRPGRATPRGGSSLLDEEQRYEGGTFKSFMKESGAELIKFTVFEGGF